MSENKIADNVSAQILLIGSGRLAEHLQHWFQFSASKQSILYTWDRQQDPVALNRYCQKATHVWLAISDSAILPFYEHYLKGYDFKTIHFSGSFHDSRMISAHPLMTFSSQLYSEDFYPKINFALTGCTELSDALPGFKNPFFILPTEKKSIYHALCVVAGNFPQILWREVYKTAEKNSIPVEIFEPYIQKVAENFIDLKEKSLTGPFIRKDLETVEKNKLALKNTSFESIYTAFQKEFFK